MPTGPLSADTDKREVPVANGIAAKKREESVKITRTEKIIKKKPEKMIQVNKILIIFAVSMRISHN
jgi:hypothetical protein